MTEQEEDRVNDNYLEYGRKIAALNSTIEHQLSVMKQAQNAIAQAMDCIRGETPEDCSFGEAEDDTVRKLQEADEAIDKALSPIIEGDKS